MKTRLLTIIILLGVFSSCQTPTSQTQEDNPSTLPNVILLIGDDQGYPYFGFMGADYVKTPNMDTLAANGFLFTDGYVSDNHCRPSLATLITGILPIDYYQQVEKFKAEQMTEDDYLSMSEEDQAEWEKNFGYYAMDHFKTLPEHLVEKGYASFQGGKWWEFDYQNGGFTHGMSKGWDPEEQKNAGWFEKHMGGDGMDLARITNQPAYDFIEETKGQPFFMWYAPSLPHYPFDAPEKYYNLYKDEDMSESAKRYYANCTWFDDAWGEMVAHLKEKGIYDNTLIVYVNDNGWEQAPKQEFWDDPMRSHNGGDKGKSSIYDMSFRSPIIFAWGDKIEKGVRSNAIIASADIPATILDYAGMEIPEDYFGKSFKSVIEGNQPSLRDEIIGNVVSTRSEEHVMGRPTEGYWIRKDNWFYRWDLTRGEKELFDLSTDLNNDNDVSAENPEMAQSLLEKLEQFKNEKGADPRL